MIISVASGKGGTGKTTVSTNLAMALGKNVAILDCDVEEPNAHLFLKPEITASQKVNAPVPAVDTQKCTFCKKCMEICRFGALAVLKKDVLIFENLCHSCGGCVKICPEGAVFEKDRSIGIVESGRVGDVDFIQGRLEIGQVMVPPVIRAVRASAAPQKVMIIDAPPGTSCPVIAAMNGTDFVLLVTEPTPFGLNDLELAVAAVRVLGIPHGLVINRADLGNDAVKDYCRREKVPILMEIPFDRRIAQIYSTGDLLIDAMPAYKEKFKELYQKIENLVNTEGRNQ